MSLTKKAIGHFVLCQKSNRTFYPVPKYISDFVVIIIQCHKTFKIYLISDELHNFIS